MSLNNCTNEFVYYPIVDVTVASYNLEKNHIYLSNHVAAVTYTLPTQAETGSQFVIILMNSNGFQINQVNNQQILGGASHATTPGVGGFLTGAGGKYHSFRFICIVDSLTWILDWDALLADESNLSYF